MEDMFPAIRRDFIDFNFSRSYDEECACLKTLGKYLLPFRDFLPNAEYSGRFSSFSEKELNKKIFGKKVCRSIRSIL